MKTLGAKLIRWNALFLGATALIAPRGLQAQTWQTVDDFTYPTNGASQANAVEATVAGDLYVAGYGVASGTWHALVRHSPDAGASWETLDDFVYPGATMNQYKAVHMDISGNLFAGGNAGGNGSTVHWVIRQSTDRGQTWTTVDDYTNSGFQGHVPKSLASDAYGNVYAAGSGVDAQGNPHWIVRASKDSGATWQTASDLPLNGQANAAICIGADLYVAGYAGLDWQVRKSSDHGTTWIVLDTYRYDPAQRAAPNALDVDSAGNLYVAGSAYGKNARNLYWIIRKLPAGGSAWSTVDFWIPSGSTRAVAWGIGFSSSGGVYVTGQAMINKSYHWITRRSAAGGTAWTTVDDFSYSPSLGSGATAVIGDLSGNVFTVGYGDTSGAAHWLVRKATGQ